MAEVHRPHFVDLLDRFDQGKNFAEALFDRRIGGLPGHQHVAAASEAECGYGKDDADHDRGPAIYGGDVEHHCQRDADQRRRQPGKRGCLLVDYGEDCRIAVGSNGFQKSQSAPGRFRSNFAQGYKQRRPLEHDRD